MNTTTDDDRPTRCEADFERRIAALLDPAHEREQFELLWARIAAEQALPPTRRQSTRRSTSSLTALAATVLIGAAVAWYQRASAPSYTTLSDSPHHTCQPGPLQAETAPLERSAVDIPPTVERPDAPARDHSSRLCTPQVR